MSGQTIEPRILPGFMELLPQEQLVFDRMLKKITESFECFGFTPIDTPVLEMSEVLLAKAGGETEKQIYSFIKGDTGHTMRFDLTVPLARYVAKNQHLLTFPFRRYQIGKVWRGERPQKGRFREFYQCDIDIIGDGELSILNDAEIPAIIFHTFKSMGFEDFTIRVNNRKVLSGLCEHIGFLDRVSVVLRIIDKLDKIGEDKVREELKLLNMDSASIDTVIRFIALEGSPDRICRELEALPIDNENFKKGVEELRQISKYITDFGIPENNFKVDLTIARGLDYYTGTVYETILNDYPQLGSVCSGGRYDNLAEYFTDRKLPGVGISIGLSRLFFQLMEAQIIKTAGGTPTQCLIIPMGDTLGHAISFATAIRTVGIKTSLHLENKGMKQKMNFANKLMIPFVAIIGEDEVRENVVTLKDMENGSQEKVDFVNAISKIKSALYTIKEK